MGWETVENPKMPYPMQKKHQNMCYQTIMMPLVSQSVDFWYTEMPK